MPKKYINLSKNVNVVYFVLYKHCKMLQSLSLYFIVCIRELLCSKSILVDLDTVCFS